MHTMHRPVPGAQLLQITHTHSGSSTQQPAGHARSITSVISSKWVNVSAGCRLVSFLAFNWISLFHEAHPDITPGLKRKILHNRITAHVTNVFMSNRCLCLLLILHHHGGKFRKCLPLSILVQHQPISK